ncbi:MAG: 1-deoxy-D-xylulose-5-phosphate synthase [Muribaculum sp.]|nr:1-deoxy-D-xylulose-5-phosphate synthase [Muribaculum sp.]
MKESEYPLLSGINDPSDLRKLSPDQLPAVCDELRRFLIANLSHNPGHFASSMGAIEIIVALHYVFSTPKDRVVFDVGHQAYAHKILTGRRDAFANQRSKGGISGFPNPAESEYDTFTAGHASNSISAALGMAIADKLSGADRKTVALIGDASISGGLAFEGLNNAANNPNDLLIILNDNEMSIDNNVGALHRYLSEITTSRGYNRWRFRLYNYFKRKGMINDRKKGFVLRFNNALKSLISHKQNIFEGLNIRYLGPFDGHDVIKLVKTLSELKNMSGPRLLHVNTVKGKGFPKAEEDPTTWHAPGKFNPITGERLKSSKSTPKWQDIFGNALLSLAREDENIVGITAAMPSGTSMRILSEEFPERTFDVGISEGHAVTFAGGLAAAGKHPFVAIYSSFLQRAYDNIIHDVAIQHLPVTFCIDRAGLVGEDGVTHHGLFDLAYLNCIPGVVIASPSHADMLGNLMYTSLSVNGPMFIRYPRGAAPDAPENLLQKKFEQMEIGQSLTLRKSDNPKAAILTLGPVAENAMKAAETLAEAGVETEVVDMIWLKPLDLSIIKEIADRHDLVVTVEDGAVKGGFGQSVAIALHEAKETSGSKIDVVNLGIRDRWIYHATPAQLQAEAGIDADAIVNTILSRINR